jgi:hypothetical protein
MPIKSGFLPKEALQGQDLPSHILWSDLRFDSIKIRHSKDLTLKEIYNVPCDCHILEDEAIVVKRVEVDGYLGLVLSTKILTEKATDVSVEYDFVLNNQVLEKLEFQAHLFRPDIVIGDTPIEICVATTNDEVLPKIPITNLGEGTAIIDVDTVPGSDLQKHYPEFVERFMEEYRTDIHFSITRLKKHFKEYSALLSALEKYLVEPPAFTKEMLKDLEDFINREIAPAYDNEPTILADPQDYDVTIKAIEDYRSERRKDIPILDIENVKRLLVLWTIVERDKDVLVQLKNEFDLLGKKPMLPTRSLMFFISYFSAGLLLGFVGVLFVMVEYSYQYSMTMVIVIFAMIGLLPLANLLYRIH